MNSLSKTALLFAGLLLPACESTCPGPAGYVAVEGLSMIAQARPVGILAAGQQVKAQDLILRLELLERYYTTNFLPKGGFAAWADCNPKPPIYTELVDSLVVTSENDFDSRHPAGTSLNDLLRISDSGGTTMLTDFLITPRSVQTIANQHLTLTVPPTSSATQRFRARIHLTNGNVYTAVAAAVSVQP